MLDVKPIPAFDDNYIWMLRRDHGLYVAVVDPGDPEPVLERLQDGGLQLSAVLITHHHWDHAGGIDELKAAFPDCHVYGPQDRRIPGVTHVVSEGSEVQPPGLNTRFRVLEVHGHTSTHIAYLGEDNLFCGDTLFAAGCGRVFDGTFDDLAASLRRLAALPPQTRVYCAHEYTLANLGFARWVEPDNPDLAARVAADTRLRNADEPTLPSTLEIELKTNPFMRLEQASVIAAAQRHSERTLETPAQVFHALRRWKDTEYD